MFTALAGIFTERPEPEEHSVYYNAQTAPLLKAAVNADPNPSKGGGDIIVMDGALVPETSPDGALAEGIAESDGEISVYIVRDGDSVSQIAQMFGVSVNTILWANDIKSAKNIQPGDTLVILPITGVRHVVKSGDTLKSIAQKYKGDSEEILAYNQLSSATDIKAGDTIVIPGGEIAAPAIKVAPKTGGKTGTVAANGYYVNPVPGAVRTQGIHGYNGVDLGASSGTTVRAAAAGQVIVSKSGGWNGGYGNYVVIKHANGTQTLYAHLSLNSVAVGDVVGQGDTIGAVGNTGRSTGSHLHFEVRGAKNPF